MVHPVMHSVSFQDLFSLEWAVKEMERKTLWLSLSESTTVNEVGRSPSWRVTELRVRFGTPLGHSRAQLVEHLTEKPGAVLMRV